MASPMAGNTETRPEQEQGADTSIIAEGYFDIMLLGLTGQGKTTTAEKLLIANPSRIDYQSSYTTLSGPTLDRDKQQMVTQDLSMWCLPSDSHALEHISTRMKSVAFFRVLNDPHEEVNRSHNSKMHVFDRTSKCELFSNETTKVRVLDVPGFFGAVTNPRRDSHDITLDAKIAHLATMRSILHIQTAVSMRFRRILYFLPGRDALELSNAGLQQELQLMVYYFGRSIFETMVLVATLGPATYKAVPKGCPVQFAQDELEGSREAFQQALKNFIPENTPNPPIIFISLRETCESILRKVRAVQVARDGLQLELNSSVCARCNMKIGDRNGMKVACTASNDWTQATIYEDSHCHPMLVPKYTRLQKIKEGVSYAVKTVVRREEWNWPDFSVEECANCHREPGSRGCMKVKTEYEGKVLEHTNLIDEDHRPLPPQATHSGPSSLEVASDTEAEATDHDGQGGILSDSLVVVSARRQQLISNTLPERTLRHNYMLDPASTSLRRTGQSHQDIFSSDSGGFPHREQVIVDIEPQPEDSVATASQQNFPEIEVVSNDSEKKGT